VPAWLEILLLALVALVIVLFVLGSLGARRRERSLDSRFRAQLEEANAALASARAEDRGWDRENLEAAARTAHTRARPEAQIRELQLIQIVDRPGKDEDQARFRVIDAHGEHEIVLGRRGDEWIEV
jgi:Flp pilus assembly protein TadB